MNVTLSLLSYSVGETSGGAYDLTASIRGAERTLETAKAGAEMGMKERFPSFQSRFWRPVGELLSSNKPLHFYF